MAIFDKTPIYQPLTSNKQLEDKYFHVITVHKNEKAIPVQYKLKPGQNGPGNNEIMEKHYVL